MELFATDTSYYQVPINGSYPWKWAIFRAGDGTWCDPIAKQNLDECRRQLAAGKLYGYTAYVVYRPGSDPRKVLDEIGYPRDRHVMLDVESWGGKISGNHSSEINKFAGWLRARQGGEAFRVWGYGNRGDLAGLWSSRPSWVRLVVASYSSTKPDVPNMVGWQYTDGETKWPAPAGWPRSSAPFGACDHNRLYLTDEDISGRANDGMELSDVVKLASGKSARVSTILANVHHYAYEAMAAAQALWAQRVKVERADGKTVNYSALTYLGRAYANSAAAWDQSRSNARAIADLTGKLDIVADKVDALCSRDATLTIPDVKLSGTLHAEAGK